MGTQMKIAAEFSRLTEGVKTPTPYLEQTSDCLATLRVLIASAPEGWNVDELDPLDADSYLQMLRVHGALRAREDGFRRKPKQASPASGPDDAADAAILVPEKV
jgi:hypothetical protein